MIMKLKPGAKFLLFILLIGIIGLIGFKYFKNNSEKIDNSLLKEHHISEKYASKTLEFVLKNNLYEEKYLKEYAKINYQDKDDFATILTTFLPKGYQGEEINYILNLSKTNQEKLAKLEYQDIQNYYKIKNFNVDNLERYNAYYKEHKYIFEDIVTYVNINLDLPVYTNPHTVTDGNSNLVLVNKYNCLDASYTPNDLAYLKGAYGNEVPMREIAQKALVKLQEAVTKEIGITLLPTTSYRNYNFQKTLYDNYVAKDGTSAADTYSARPGCSEHQTGLAIDLKNPDTPASRRLNDSDYEWLKNNAHRFGFIIRFPKDKEFITGYQEENWHIRYVGEEAAKIIYENKLTLEEYIDLYVTQY